MPDPKHCFICQVKLGPNRTIRLCGQSICVPCQTKIFDGDKETRDKLKVDAKNTSR